MSTPSPLRRLERRFRAAFPSRQERRHSLVGPPQVWQEKPAFQIAFLQAHGLEPALTLVDIGCGTLRGGIPIIEMLDAGNYAGVDVRTTIEREARAELAEHRLDGKDVTLVFGRRLADVHLDRRFDIAWAFSVLFHLTDDHLAECFAFVREHLAPGGVFFANVNLGDEPPAKWMEFPELWRPLAVYARGGRGRPHGRGSRDVVDPRARLQRRWFAEHAALHRRALGSEMFLD